MSESSRKHKAEAPRHVRVLVVTCSGSRHRNEELGREVEDESGDLIQKLLTEAGHTVVGRRIVSNDRDAIRELFRESLRTREVDSIIATGGTGVSHRDMTIEVAEEFLDKKIPGFGEFFRKISFEKIGSAAMLSRAVAGVHRGKPIFCLPGSPDAVERAMIELIIPEIGHVVKHARE